MYRTRRAVKRTPVVDTSSDSEDDIPLKKLNKTPEVKDSSAISENKLKANNTSSSESDIESYLQPIDKIDLNSSFFRLQTRKTQEKFDKIEENIFAGVTRLNDSESDEEMEVTEKPFEETYKITESLTMPSTSSTNLNFEHLDEYKHKIEEAKKHIEKYNAKKKAEDNKLDISKLLAVGESRQITLENITPEDLHSSDFESCDSEEDWEEVKVGENLDTKEKNIIPKDAVQVIVSMPDTCRKKKGVDLLAAMKRRLNRIRKENQLYVHKVHLLCWIAHGNFVNNTINCAQILGLALSLLPSDKCYPADRTDLSYLEQIVQWYNKTMQLVESVFHKDLDLANSIQNQISKKKAYNKKILVYIFIAILRSLGVQCRLVLSFQVEPLRPPAHELHSLAKENNVKVDKIKKSISKVKDKCTVGTKEKKNDKAFDKNSRKNIEGEKIGNKLKCNSEKELVNKGSSKSTRKKNTGVKSLSDNRDKQGQIKTENKPGIKKDVSSSKKYENRSECADNKPSDEVKKTYKTRNEVHINTIKTRSKSVGDTKSATTSKKEIIKLKFPKINKLRSSKNQVPQLDGLHDSSEEVPQVDGADDSKASKSSKLKKLNLQKLKSPTEKPCSAKSHSSHNKNTAREDYSSENEFNMKNSSAKKRSKSDKSSQNRKMNLRNLNPDKKKVPQFYSPPKKPLDVRNDIIGLIKGRISEQKQIDRSRMVNKRKPMTENSDSDSDYMPEPIKKKHHDSDSDVEFFVPKPKVKRRVRVGNKLSDSDQDSSGKKKKKGVNVWAEVFLESEEKWISVDVVRGQVHCVKELFTRATHPVSYIIAWNNDSSLKDVTRRYCVNFNTITRKLRVNAKWWEETLKPFMGKATTRDKEEDDDLNKQQLDQPMPKSIAEYKNHPLYVLRRHLLKFEAIYPPDIQPLGFVRGEPVYPRNCVYVCHSRDIWLKEAKVVKPGENPYKIVKARPKYDKLSNKIITDQMLEIFGEWQTGDYEPPTAENGVVPRNAFGNVELFKKCMLPKGTVHLQLPGLNKVCRRMDVDCASAIVGFDFHGGWSHPTYDGFIICEEFADVVVAAWELEQEEIERRENEKIERRVYTNWKKLIRGLLIRERLKAKYNFGSTSTNDGKEKKKHKGPRFCTKK